MATKKQRRRRSKERRHEYEYVYVDDDGREVEVDEAEVESKNGRKGTPRRGAEPSSRAVTTSAGRVIEPPTWQRVMRRAAIFAPLMAVVLYIMPGENKTLGAILLSTALLMAFFIPFSYMMDSMMYRFAVKRGAKPSGSAKDSPARGASRK